MALKIRLAHGGAKKRPFYRIVVADTRSPRDGRFIERLGSYNPMVPKDHAERVTLKEERIKHWLSVGARPTDRVARFLGAAGIIEAPPIPEQTKKNQPKPKTLERRKAAEAARAAAEEKAQEPEAPAAEAAPEAEAAVDEKAQEPEAVETEAVTEAEVVADEKAQEPEAPAPEEAPAAPAAEETTEAPAAEEATEAPADESAEAAAEAAPESPGPEAGDAGEEPDKA